MINFLDVYARALEGPVIGEKEFNLKHFVPALKDVVKAHGIKYDKESPVPWDDEAADNLYDAAVDFLGRVGVYCMDTNRVIHFTREEILQAVKEAPGACFVGEGKDAAVLAVRKPDDRRVCGIHVGWGTIHASEEIATNLMEALASIPEAKAMSVSATVSHIRGIPVAAGSPVEIYAAIRAIRIAREAMRRAGRPGMAMMNLIATAASAVTTIAASAPQFGLRPSDGWLIGVPAEMKTDFGGLNKAAYLLNWGANIGPETAPSLGGWCGGPEGTAVVNTAYFLMGLLVYQGNYHLTFPIHSHHGCCSTRDILWVVASSCQAASRNIPVPVIWLGYMAAGCNTKMYFHESAAYLLAATTSGAASVKMPTPARGVKIDASTPMEAYFGVSVTKGAARLDRQRANELVLRLLEKYESDIPSAPEGDRYQDCYNVETSKPGDAYARLYDETVDELTRMGIPFD